jgi:hypothetical protein
MPNRWLFRKRPAAPILKTSPEEERRKTCTPNRTFTGLPLEGHRTPPKGSFDFTARGDKYEDIQTRQNGAD